MRRQEEESAGVVCVVVVVVLTYFVSGINKQVWCCLVGWEKNSSQPKPNN
jgi:hypothetical protein